MCQRIQMLMTTKELLNFNDDNEEIQILEDFVYLG